MCSRALLGVILLMSFLYIVEDQCRNLVMYNCTVSSVWKPQNATCNLTPCHFEILNIITIISTTHLQVHTVNSVKAIQCTAIAYCKITNNPITSLI